VRSLSKVRFLVGLAHRVAIATGAIDTTAVRETLGRLAALEATIAALVDAQVSSYDRVPAGGICPNRRYVYAALNWCQETLPVLIDTIRDLSGAGTFKFPATIDVAGDPQTRAAFARFWSDTERAGVDHMQLFKLSWDIVGSEFAGRQQLYERFYAGPPHVVRSHSYRESPWD
jgi:4-hydroxyphenylacetate 3-monooxygenase